MTHSFIAYIDESGDDGLQNYREPGGRGGASSWLGISSLVMRQSYELDAIRWRDEISNKVPEKKSRNIHFAEFRHEQKVVAAECLAEKPVRAISVLSNKRTIPAGVYTEKNQLYFYLTRHLIERISWLCRDMRPQVPQGDGRVKIVFSRRGGMSYEDFQDYLTRLKNNVDQAVNIHWPVIDIDSIQAQDHSRHAGLQLADVVASSFTSGFEPNRYGHCESRYAEILKRVVYERRGNYLSYGLKLLPNPANAGLNQHQTRTLDLFR